MSFSRIFLLVLDSLGVGEMPDAAEYGDAGSDTLGNIAKAHPLRLPHFEALGLANIRPVTGMRAAKSPLGSLGPPRAREPRQRYDDRALGIRGQVMAGAGKRQQRLQTPECLQRVCR